MANWAYGSPGGFTIKDQVKLKNAEKLRYRNELEAQIAAKQVDSPYRAYSKASFQSPPNLSNDSFIRLQAQQRQMKYSIANELLASQQEKQAHRQALREQEAAEARQRNAIVTRNQQLDLKMQKDQRAYFQQIAEHNMQQAALQKEIQQLRRATEQASERYLLSARQRQHDDQRRMYDLQAQSEIRSKSTTPSLKPKDREAERVKLQQSFENYNDPSRISELMLRKLVYKSAADDLRLNLDRQLQEKRRMELDRMRENEIDRERLQRQEELFKERYRQQRLQKLKAQRELHEALAGY